MKIYTKTGDAGETSLLGGRRVSKADIQINAYGSVDELNACIGMLADGDIDDAVHAELRDIQATLFVVGSQLAQDSERPVGSLPTINSEDIEVLEKAIDDYTEQIPELKHFILPGGHPLVSYAHVARAICRRAERDVVLLSRSADVDPLLIQYLNRLSDYLFVVARYIAHLRGVEEIIWKGISS